MKRKIKHLTPIIPYLSVLIGMYAIHSAWAAILLYHTIALLVMLTCKNKNEHVQKSDGWPLLPYIVIIACSAGGVIFYYIWPYITPNSNTLAHKLQYFNINKHNWLYFAVYFCIVNSIIEELFWRGYLGSDHKAIHKNDLLFAGYHALVLLAFTNIIWTIPLLATCTFAGWLWRTLRMIKGNLTIPILTHIIADFSIIMAVHYRLFTR